MFGGPYPGTDIIGRLYVIHILLVPGVLLALISAHLGILFHQKHTQFPGPGKTEDNVVGERVFPVYGAKAGGYFALVFGVLAILGGLCQINPIWLYGPYNPATVSAGSQPDWYIGFLDGAVRIMPNWEFRGFGYDIPFMLLVPGLVMPGIMFGGMALYPFLEQRKLKDFSYHNLLQRPRDTPNRTAIGVAWIAAYGVMWGSGGNDIVASTFHVSLNALTWLGRFGLFIIPTIAFFMTKRICLGLQRRDREAAEHGYETGIVRRLPSGEYIEVHAPLPEAPMPHLVPVETTTFGELAAGTTNGELAEHGDHADLALTGSGTRTPAARVGPARSSGEGSSAARPEPSASPPDRSATESSTARRGHPQGDLGVAVAHQGRAATPAGPAYARTRARALARDSWRATESVVAGKRSRARSRQARAGAADQRRQPVALGLVRVQQRELPRGR